MKRFHFKLEPVLKDRKRSEDMRLREWSLAQKILERMKSELLNLEKMLSSSIEKADQSPLNIGLMNSINSFIDATKIRISWKVNEIERAKKLVEKTRLSFLHASQKRKVIEKLKENQKIVFKKAVQKKELKDLDDVYIMRHHLHSVEENEAGYEEN